MDLSDLEKYNVDHLKQLRGEENYHKIESAFVYLTEITFKVTAE